MKSCLICDDHALLREALAGSVLHRWPDARVTQVGDFQSAWAEAEHGHDICIADLIMPGAGPLEGIGRLQAVAPKMPILVLTGTDDDALLLELMRMGVAGFASKTASAAVIEAALNLIEAGGRYLPPRIGEIAASRLDTIAPAPRPEPVPEPAPFSERLTGRQMDVLSFLAHGLTNKEIARNLALAPSTVKTHLANLQVQFGASNRTELAMKAQTFNLLGKRRQSAGG